MPEAGKGKTAQDVTSRKTQDLPQARGQSAPTGPYGDIMLLQNRIGNRAIAELLQDQAGKAPGIGLNARYPLHPALRAVMESIQSKRVAEMPVPVPALTIAPPSPLTFSMQAKLAVGAVNDPLESEADRAAEHVMRMPGHAAITAANGGKVLRRKCDTCECEACQKAEQKKHPKLNRAGAHDAAAFDGTIAPAIVLDVLNSPGQALDPATRAFFEPRFGHDLSGVRVHTDSRAAESAKSVGALAYTAGSDIVFGSNQYDPAGTGNRLLAHELAHTIQQRGGTSARKDANGGVRQNRGNAIRRAPAPTPAPLPATVPTPGPSDFEITRVANSSTSSIFFAKNSAALDTNAKTQIAAIKASAPGSVRLLGFSSADENSTVAQARAKTVKTELAASPKKVTVASAVGNAGAQASQSDFSQARKVEVVVGSAPAATLDCKKRVKGKLVNPPTAPCATMDPPTETAFKGALKIANDAMTRATTAVASTPNAADIAVIDKFFGNHDPGTLSTLKTNLGKLASHVSGLPGITSCGGQCDSGGCAEGAIAYNTDVDAASRMTVCVPTFKSLSTDEDRARNLIHESAHGTSPLGGPAAPKQGTEDVAYRHERLISQLSTADRLRNSDSYALFALHLRARQKAGNATAIPPGISKPATDKIAGFTVAGEKAAVDAAMAQLEKRLTWCKDWMGQLYGEMLKVRSGAKKWSKSWANNLMKETAKRFPLAPPSSTPPKLKDQTLEAGILDRYRRMHAGVKRNLTITRMTAGIVSWGAGSSGAWVAADTVKIGPDFFKATPANQISILLEALAKQTRDVEPAFIPAYVSLAEWIHSQNP